MLACRLVLSTQGGRPCERPRRSGLTQYDRVAREDGEVRVQLEEEVKLIGRAPNAVGKEESVTLQPLHGLRWILETDAGTAHREGSGIV